MSKLNNTRNGYCRSTKIVVNYSMAYVYRHIRLDKNEPFYIGIGSGPTYKRANNPRDRNIFWKRIVAKTEYEVEIMLDDLTWEEACNKEKEFISLYGRSDKKLGSLSNLTDGGEGQLGYIFSEERKKEISQRYSNGKGPFYGKIHKPETIEILKYNAKHRSPETNRKIALANSNKIVPKEIRLKISNSTNGDKNHFYGKGHTKESREKISIKATGRICSDETKNKMSLNVPTSLRLYKEIDGVIIQYNSIRDAARKTGMKRCQLQLNYKKYGFYTIPL
jgi:hypothetical protein